MTRVGAPVDQDDEGLAGPKPALHATGPFECFGQRFVIRTADADLVTFIREMYEPLACDDASGAVTYSLIPPSPGAAGSLTDHRSRHRMRPRRSQLLEALVGAINRQVIVDTSSEHLTLHAAAADLDGSAVLLPAPMESGKSTLVTALLDRGFGYLTDEAARLLPNLDIEGFPKPLSIDPGSWATLAHREPAVASSLRPYLEGQWQVPVQTFAPVVRRSRLARVIFPKYEAGARLSLEPLKPSEAVGLAYACVFSPSSDALSTDHLRRIAGMVERIPTFRLIHSDAAGASRLIAQEMSP